MFEVLPWAVILWNLLNVLEVSISMPIYDYLNVDTYHYSVPSRGWE